MKKKTYHDKNNLKVAIFGCGKMGRHHYEAVKLQDCADVAAVADTNAHWETLKAHYDNEVEFFSDPEKLLKNVKPDVVHIITPPSTHANLAKLCLNYGANIYVEKPFAYELAEAESIISLAENAHLKVCAGHQVLFEHAAIETKIFLKEIGEIVHVESYFSFRKVRKSISNVDQLLDILPHPVYLLLNFLNVDRSGKSEREIDVLSIDVNAQGDAYGMFKYDDINGTLKVTLRGRPIESYVRIIGTNGLIYADFVSGAVSKIAGPGSSAVSVLLKPYSLAKQTIVGSTKGFGSRALRKQKSYPGLFELIELFYSSILKNTPQPLTNKSITETVKICQIIGDKLRDAESLSETQAESRLREMEKTIASVSPDKKDVLVTGGTGYLGSRVASELRNNGWPVRVLSRHLPSYAVRIPGVQYFVADLGEKIPDDLLDGVESVVHCAAETMGGKEDQERNSVTATINILEASAHKGVKNFIHISSIAVLKTSSEMNSSIDETTPLDIDNISRGPYVWGKAKAEQLVVEMSKKLEIKLRIIRPGPLVDYKNFEAPGRLGREMGSLFIVMGDKKSNLSICDVNTIAHVIRSYICNIDEAPPVLNMVEPDAPTRAELIARLLKKRPDLKALCIPTFFVNSISVVLKIVQRIVFPKRKPLDIKAAFASENYNANLASAVIKTAKETLNRL